MREREKETELQQQNAGRYLLFQNNIIASIDFTRQRKLERIAQLDSEVTQLKEENMSLSQMKEELLREAKMLKNKLQHHVNCGCIIMMDMDNNIAWNHQQLCNKLVQE